MSVKSLEEQLREAQNLAKVENDPALRKLAAEEIQRLRREIFEIEESSHPNAILEIRSGTGGDEAELFAKDLFRMYQKFAEKSGWKLEILNSSFSNLGGIKEIIIRISGDKVYGYLRFEGGVHRVQRIPKTEKRGRVHTSAATVAVLPEVSEQEIQINSKDIRVDVFRSKGHGGQGVNTTDSAVRLSHLPTGLVVTCQDERSQLKNRQKALKILRSRIYQLEQQKREQTLGAARRKFIGSGDRSEKVRTYNFPQNRLTDHRISRSWQNLDEILEGNLDKVIIALKSAEKE